MDYRITDKEVFTVLASSKVFDYENAKQEIPAFWLGTLHIRKEESMCAECLGSTLTRRWAMSVLSILLRTSTIRQ